MQEIALDGEVFILLGVRECGTLTILTFYHKQNQPDYDHDWTPSITKVLKSMGTINELDYCCVVFSFYSGSVQRQERIAIITPEFFEKHHILAFLYDACHSYQSELSVRIITFWGDGIFTTTTLSKCFLPGPTPKRLKKLMNLTEMDMGKITVYPVEGSNLHIKAAEYKSLLY